MAKSIEIDIPRRALGSDLMEALEGHGLHAVIVDTDERCALHVSFATGERERLVDQAVHAIESYLSEQMLPLVVQRADGSVVVRPPGD